MRTVRELKIDLEPDTLVRQVMSDPNHQARVRARTERERKAYQTKTERQLAAVKAQRKKDREQFLLRHTQLKMDCNATTAAVTVCALFAGYCLAFV